MPEGKLPENIPELLKQLREEGVPHKEFANRVDEYLGFKAREHHIPYSGTFELTPMCNLDCKMCYIHLTKERMNGVGLLRVEQWKQLMRQAKDAGMRHAKLTGGECLTYPGFDELYLFLQDMGVQVTVLTNGILLDEKRIQFFAEHPVRYLQVTLYGSNEDAYEKVTGHRQFARVWENLKKAKEAKLPLSIALTPSAFMEEDAEALIARAEELEVEYIINASLFPPREDTGRMDKAIEPSLDTYIKMSRISRQYQSVEMIPVPEETLPVAKTTGEPVHGVRCGAGRSGFEITWQGRMYACTNLHLFGADPFSEESEDGDEPSTPFMNAWKKIWHAAETLEIPVECEGCVYQAICVPCVAVHLQNGCINHCNKYFCNRIKKMTAAGIYKLNEKNPDDRPDCR